MMKAPINQNEYPRFFKVDTALLAFVAKDKMYKISPIGSNTNPGITLDHYITRNMVLRHWPYDYWKYEISKNEFERLSRKLYNSIIDKIVS